MFNILTTLYCDLIKYTCISFLFCGLIVAKKNMVLWMDLCEFQNKIFFHFFQFIQIIFTLCYNLTSVVFTKRLILVVLSLEPGV